MPVRKAVSPLLAAVLLVIITIAVASIVNKAMTGFAEQQAQEIESSARTECYSVFLSATNPVFSNSSQAITMILENTGTADALVTRVQVIANNTEQASSEPLLSVPAGGVSPLTISSVSQAVYDDLDMVRIVSDCPDKSITLYKADIRAS